MSETILDYKIFELVSLQENDQNLFPLLGEIAAEDKSILKSCLTKARCVLIEREYIDKDYRNAYSGYYSKKFSETSNRAMRLHLFDVTIVLTDLHHPFNEGGLSGRLKQLAAQENTKHVEGTTDGYLGYVVLRPTEYSRIGRCLLDPRKVGVFTAPDVEGCLAPYTADVFGQKLDVSAFPHQSQDAEVHICAHTAVWSLFRYLSQKYATYKEHYPYDVALLNKDLHYGRPLPSRGLYMDQVTAMFGQFGLAAEMYKDDLVGDVLEHGGTEWAAVQPLQGQTNTGKQKKTLRSRRNKDSLLHLLHVYLDSGLPSVVGVPGHAVVTIGVEYAREPKATRPGRVIPSTDFISSIIINDDNCAPYQKAVRVTGQPPLRYSCEEIDSLVVPLPEKLFLAAEKAEFMITDLLETMGVPDLSSYPSIENPEAEKFVRRLYSTSAKNFRAFRSRDDDPVSRELLRHPLPHFIWVGELLLLSQWGNPNRKAIAEIALDATAGPFDEAPFLWIRYPGILVINFGRIYGYRAALHPRMVLEVSDPAALIFSSFDGNLRRFT